MIQYFDDLQKRPGLDEEPFRSMISIHFLHWLDSTVHPPGGLYMAHGEEGLHYTLNITLQPLWQGAQV